MHSPYAAILDTNFVPSVAECDQIRDYVRAPQQRVLSLNAEIERLSAVLNETIRQRDELSSHVHSHLALVSPMRRLPLDILQMIFLATLPEERNAVVSYKECPLLLGRICRSWRTLALETRRLWGSVHLVVPPERQLDAMTDWVREKWFARAGPAVPISLSTAFSCTSSQDYSIAPLLSTVKQLAPRWRNVKLVVPHSADLKSFEDLSFDQVSSLESLEIEPGFRFFRNVLLDVENPRFFTASPRIERLTLPGHPYFLRLPVSWSSLRHLKLSPRGNLTYEAAWGIIRNCVALESCDLHCCHPRRPTTPTLLCPPFTLPQLQSIAINHSRVPTTAQALHFFSPIDFPVLRAIHCRTSSTLPPDVPLMAILPSSLARVKTLSISVYGVKSSDLIAALHATPMLRTLTILAELYSDSTTPDSSFLAHLLAEPSSGTSVHLCPQLTSVTLAGFNNHSDVLIREFLLDRTASDLPVRLTHFKSTLYRDRQTDIMPALQDAIKGGLSVELKYLPISMLKYSAFEGTMP